ncbi:MAG: LLM class flavin-dependent oxidoreductase [Dehalococcoidia bacterium]
MADPKFGVLLQPTPLDQAEQVERLGFDSLWVSEHMLFYVPTFDAVTVLAAFAARTQRILLGSAVLLLPLRHPTVIAKEVASLDIISNGRIILGIGVGGEFPREFVACGVPVNERGRRTDEAIVVMRRLWSESHVNHEGRFFRLEEASMEPKPVQKPGPPIWVAGRSEAAMKRAARLGDGYVPYLFSPERYRDSLAQVAALAEQGGRDPASIEPALYQFICMADTYDEARQRANRDLSVRYNQPFDRIVDRYCVLGPPDQCAERLLQYVEAGVRHFILVPIALPAELPAHLEAYAGQVVPKVRAALN